MQYSSVKYFNKLSVTELTDAIESNEQS